MFDDSYEHKAIFKFYDIVDSIGRAAPKLNGPADTPVRRFLYVCSAALIERAEAMKILYSVGHQHSADIIARNISEITVHMYNAARYGQPYMDRLRITTLDSYRSMCQHCLNHSEESLGFEGVNDYKSRVNSAKTEIRKLEKKNSWPPQPNNSRGRHKIRKKAYTLGVCEAFKMAHLFIDYGNYKLLCQRTHVDLYRLTQDHSSDYEDFGFIDIGKKLSPCELKLTLQFTSKMLVSGIGIALNFCGVENDEFNCALDSFDELKAILESF